MKSVFLLCILITLSSLISSCSVMKKKNNSMVQDIQMDMPMDLSFDSMDADMEPKKPQVVEIKEEMESSPQMSKEPAKPSTIEMIKPDEKDEMITRAPASIKPQKMTGSIMYTPLWVQIPISNCLEIVKNLNYKNGACIKRIP